MTGGMSKTPIHEALTEPLTNEEITMDELGITILQLEMKESDLRDEITKPTDFGRCPTTSELLDLSKSFTELGKVVYSINVLKKLKKDIAFNKNAEPKRVSR